MARRAAPRRSRRRAARGALDEAIREADAATAALGPIPALEQAALALELRSGRTDAALARLDRMLRGPARSESLLQQRAEIARLAEGDRE